jgi:hypothetical protein
MGEICARVDVLGQRLDAGKECGVAKAAQAGDVPRKEASVKDSRGTT